MKDDSKNKLVKSLILNLSEIFEDKKFSFPRKEILIRRSFTESWFSDTLAWLLDPKGSHGFGVKFANEFFVRIPFKYYSQRFLFFPKPISKAFPTLI